MHCDKIHPRRLPRLREITRKRALFPSNDQDVSSATACAGLPPSLQPFTGSAAIRIKVVDLDEKKKAKVLAKKGKTLRQVGARAAAVRGVPLIDLRIVCGEDADFVNAIEPSEQGGKKIAAGIVSFLAKHEFRSGRAELIVR